LKKYFSKELINVWNGFVDEDYIIEKYRKVKSKVSGMLMYFFVKKDPSKFWIIPNSSRWNDQGKYKRNTLNKIKYHLTGLRVGVMLTLTFYKPLMEKYISDWWVYGYELFLIFVANPLLSDFLDQLRKLKKRYGRNDRRST
jgi:hypothetical protein